MDQSLDDLFAAACNKVSDIYEHLPFLKELGEECKAITELTASESLYSTVAFLSADPKELTSYRMSKPPIISIKAQLEPLRGDSILLALPYSETIKETDLLFIDTTHTHTVLKKELENFHSKVRKYIVIHDTATYANRGEDGSAPGLKQTIHDFIDEENQWKIIHDIHNNNGMIVLEKDEINPSIDRIYTIAHFDLPDIRWVERFTVGSTHPDRELTQEEVEWQMKRVNAALRYGKITGLERNLVTIEVGSRTVTTSYLIYHIGFKSRPPGK